MIEDLTQYISPSGGGIIYPSGQNDYQEYVSLSEGVVYSMPSGSFIYIYPSGTNMIFPSGGTHYQLQNGGISYVYPYDGIEWVNPSGSDIKYIYPSGGGLSYIYPSGYYPEGYSDYSFLPSGGNMYINPSGMYTFVYPQSTPNGFSIYPSGGYVMPSGGYIQPSGGDGGQTPKLYQYLVIKEIVEPYYAINIKERIVEHKTTSMPILEKIISYLNLDIQLVDFNNITLKWSGEPVPAIDIYKKVTIDKEWGEPIARVPYSKGSYLLSLDEQPYNVKVLGVNNTGESQVITIGIGKTLPVETAFDLGYYKKSIVLDLTFVKHIEIEVNF